MNKYKDLFLPLPPAAMEIAFRTLEIPFYTDTPFNAYGFVPALIPLWATDSPSYTGYWKHWFAPQRQPTFVEVYVRDEYGATEISRDFMQLMLRVLLIAITIEGTVTSDIQKFARQAGVNPTQLTEIAGLAEANGADDAILINLPAFAPDPPLTCYQGDAQDYPGDFPHDEMALTAPGLSSVCTFEVSEELGERIRHSPFAPPWFTTTDQPQLFARLLQKDDLQGAWMSLNSAGWRFAEAKEAIRQLERQSSIPGFDRLVDAWTAEPHESSGAVPEEARY